MYLILFFSLLFSFVFFIFLCLHLSGVLFFSFHRIFVPYNYIETKHTNNHKKCTTEKKIDDFMRNSMTKPTPRNYRVLVSLFTSFICVCVCLLLLILTSLLFVSLFSFHPKSKKWKKSTTHKYIHILWVCRETKIGDKTLSRFDHKPIYNWCTARKKREARKKCTLRVRWQKKSGCIYTNITTSHGIWKCLAS